MILRMDGDVETVDGERRSWTACLRVPSMMVKGGLMVSSPGCQVTVRVGCLVGGCVCLDAVSRHVPHPTLEISNPGVAASPTLTFPCPAVQGPTLSISLPRKAAGLHPVPCCWGKGQWTLVLRRAAAAKISRSGAQRIILSVTNPRHAQSRKPTRFHHPSLAPALSGNFDRRKEEKGLAHLLFLKPHPLYISLSRPSPKNGAAHFAQRA
jgi:hypothetical protein